jgi:hypothetical protein
MCRCEDMERDYRSPLRRLRLPLRRDFRRQSWRDGDPDALDKSIEVDGGFKGRRILGTTRSGSFRGDGVGWFNLSLFCLLLALMDEPDRKLTRDMGVLGYSDQWQDRDSRSGRHSFYCSWVGMTVGFEGRYGHHCVPLIVPRRC